MQKKKLVFSLATLAVAGGGVYLALDRETPSVAATPSLSSPDLVVVEPPSDVSPAVPVAPAKVEERARLRPNPHSPELFNYPVAPVRGYTNASTDFMDLVLGQDAVPVSNAELEQLLDHYIAVFRQRANYEATIATVESAADNELLLTIPPYGEVGSRLTDELYARFSSVIGDDRATALRDEIGIGLYMRNLGFGDAAQTIRITLRDSQPEIRYDVSHKAETLTVVTKLADGQSVPISVTNAGHTASGATLDELSQYAGFAHYLPKGGVSR